MENDCEFRRWDELLPDALGQIFHNLSLEEILTVVPRVCKSWAKVVNGPYCWQEIDIEDWSNLAKPQDVDRMLQMLITFSCGSLQKLCVSNVSSESFTYIVENAPALKSLLLPRNDMIDTIVEQVAPKLTAITSLNLSYSRKLGVRALESIGKHCKSLTWFHWNIHPAEMHDRTSLEDEAHVIAMSMPNLKHLGIAYLLVNTGSVLEILYNCPFLECLDLRGCWNVKLDENFVKEKFPKLKILGPDVQDDFEYCHSWDDSESNYDSDSTDGVFDDEGRFEFSFYQEGYVQHTGYGWPPSP